MAEPVQIPELASYVSAIKIPQVPTSWPELVAEWKAKETGAWIQLVDATAVAGLPHILFSVFNTLSAFQRGYNKLDRLEAELLLVLSGTDRFQEAIAVIGAKVGKPGIAIVVARERDSCISLMDRIDASIVGVAQASDPTHEEVVKVARIRNLHIPSAFESPSDAVHAIISALVERGALIYC